MIIRKKNIKNKPASTKTSSTISQSKNIIKKEDVILDIEKAKNTNQNNDLIPEV